MNKKKNKNKKKIYSWGDEWKNRIIEFPKRKHLKLEDLDIIPYIDENNIIINNKKNEREEQYIANDFIKPNMTVLELGGRYGTVSCVINNKLENPRNHVVFEPDKLVIPALIKNRNTHKSKFTIVNGIIGSKPMKLQLRGYASKTEFASSDDKNIIKNITLEEIMKKTKLKFDCLVADCEGCLCDFFKENSDYIKNYKMVVFEGDYPNECDYNEIKNNLKSWGFNVIVDRFVSVWTKN